MPKWSWMVATMNSWSSDGQNGGDTAFCSISVQLMPCGMKHKH
jgi:hypothetical protein